jgi:hypothetical protein
LQKNEEDDDNDFDAAISVSDTHDLLDGAILVIDGKLQQHQQPSTTNQPTRTAVLHQRRADASPTLAEHTVTLLVHFLIQF